MDGVLNTILKQGNNDNWQQLSDSLKSKIDVIVSAALHLVSDGSIQSTLLLSSIQSLNILENTMGTAILLSTQADNLPEECQKMFLSISNLFFSQAHKDQISFCHKEVSNISGKLANVAAKCDKSKLAVHSLLKAIHLLRPNNHCLTPAHCHFLQTCIAAQMYHAAVDFIRANDILEVDLKRTSLSSSDYLRYFYYAGICFIGVKDFDAALEAFTQAITMPANAVSYLVVCCVKKAKLVSLIQKGATFSVPNRSVSSVVSRFLAQDLAVYDDIEKCFLANNADGLATCVNEIGFETLGRDLNYGLAKQVVEALTKHRIKKLTRTYITLSLSDIAQSVGGVDLRVVERFVVDLVRTGEIDAKIDGVTGMVRFGEVCVEEDARSSGESCAKLNELVERSIDQTMVLSDHLKDLQKTVLTSSSHILKSISTNSGGAPNRGGGGLMGLGSWGGGGGMGDFGMNVY